MNLNCEEDIKREREALMSRRRPSAMSLLDIIPMMELAKKADITHDLTYAEPIDTTIKAMLKKWAEEDEED